MSELPLLRIYWYDGTSFGPSRDQISLAEKDDVKIRLGLVTDRGEQKGVDSLIVTDMLTLARNRAMSECILLSGDEDVRIGVQQAQELGVRVHLLGIESASKSQSDLLRRASDTTHEWTRTDLEVFLICNCSPVRGQDQGHLEISAKDADILRDVAQYQADQVSDRELLEVLQLTEKESWPRRIHGP